MYKINLHAHTRYSDGSSTIRQHAISAKNDGYTCCCITDHVYSKNSKYSLEKETFINAVREAKEISIELDFPIIVGIELGIASYQEVLVFGNSAILNIFEERDSENLSLDVFKNIINHIKSCVIWCHPFVDKRFYELKFWEILDGYELYNSGCQMFKLQDIPEEIKNITQFSNSDAHSVRSLNFGYNWFEKHILNECELIDYIKAKKSVKMFASCMDAQ